MKSILFGVRPLAPVSFALLAFVLVASYLPARRVFAIHPADVLKAE